MRQGKIRGNKIKYYRAIADNGSKVLVRMIDCDYADDERFDGMLGMCNEKGQAYHMFELKNGINPFLKEKQFTLIEEGNLLDLYKAIMPIS